MIITLAHKINKGYDSDCVQYFPSEANEVLELPSVTIECSEVQKSKFVNVRKLKVKSTTSDRVQELSHYHFTGWPDWETPVGPSLESFYELVKVGADFVKQQNNGGGQKLLLHCRAGIGRTGTTIALINCMLHIDEHKGLGGDIKQTPLSVFSIVRRLREQRILMC